MSKSVFVVYGLDASSTQEEICTKPLNVSTTKADAEIFAVENAHTIANGMQMKIDEFQIGGNGTKRKSKPEVVKTAAELTSDQAAKRWPGDTGGALVQGAEAKASNG